MFTRTFALILGALLWAAGAPASVQAAPPEPSGARIERARPDVPARALTQPPLAASQPVSPVYQVTAIEPPATYERSRALGINDNGVVVGRYYNYDAGTDTETDRVAFLWSAASGLEDLPLLTPGGEASAWGVNTGGLISGWATNASGDRRACRWNGSASITELGTLTNPNTMVSGDLSDGYSLNVLGTVVGLSEIPNDDGDFVPYHAIRYTDGSGLEDLGTLTTIWPQWMNGYSIAYQINTSGQSVGTAGDDDFYFKPFIHDDANGMQQLMIDAAYPSNQWYAVALTDDAYIGGHVIAAENQSLPYTWADPSAAPAPVTMPTGFPYGEILDVNSSGQMVGIMWDSASENAVEHAFIYDEVNGVRDANDLIHPDSGWTLIFARSINASGQIVGYGSFGGDFRGFVLTPAEPVPGPPAWLLAPALLAAGLALLGRRS